MSEKQPKKTAVIKELLEGYVTLQRRIDYIEGRIAFLEERSGSPSSTNFSGMPGGSHDRSSKQERDTIKKLELEEELGEMNAEENRRRYEIEEMIRQMEKPEEQTVIEMHYLDCANWRAVSLALHGDEPDYDEHEKRYLKKTFKIHGSALQTLLRIYNEQRE